MLNTLLYGTIDEHPKTRRVAKGGVLSLMERHYQELNSKVLNEHLLHFGERVLTTTQGDVATNTTRKLQFLSLLRSSITILSDECASKVVQLLIKSAASANGQQMGGVGRQAQMATSTILSTATSLLNRPDHASFDPKILQDVVRALRGGNMMPSVVGVSVSAPSAYTASWAVTLASSVRALAAATSSSLSRETAPDAYAVVDDGLASSVESLVEMLVDDDELTLRAVSKGLSILSECVNETVPSVGGGEDDKNAAARRLCLAFGRILQQPRYSAAWIEVMPAVSLFCDRLLTSTAKTSSVAPAPTPFINSSRHKYLIPLIHCVDNLRQSCVGSGSTTTNEALVLATESVLSTCLRRLGVESFLAVVTLHIRSSSVSSVNNTIVAPERSWILPFLTRQMQRGDVPCTLAYFRKRILGLAGACEKRAQGHAKAERDVQQKHERVQCVRLWSLLPGFCSSARDVSSSFGSLARGLGQAVADNTRYPELVLVVCRGLSRLVERSRRDPSIRTALSAYAQNFLPLFFNQVDKCHGVWPQPAAEMGGDATMVDDDDKQQKRKIAHKHKVPIPNGGMGKGGSAERVAVLANTVRDYTAVTESALLDNLAKQVFRKLAASAVAAAKYHDETPATSSSVPSLESVVSSVRTMVVMLTVATAMVPNLSDVAAEKIFQLVGNLVSDDAFPLVQKRAYTCLEALCGRERELPVGLLDRMHELLHGSLVTCTATSKRHRLGCLQAFIEREGSKVRLSERKNANNLAQLLGEILLCTKESNRRARDAAFAVLVSLTRSLPDTDEIGNAGGALDGTGPVTKSELLQMAAGALATHTPHMRSAALQGLSVILFEIATSESEDPAVDVDDDDAMDGMRGHRSVKMGSELLETVLVLLREKSREVVKSVLGFLKVAISVVPEDDLLPLVPQIVRGLLLWSNEAKNRFRLKVRVLIERLIRKLGADAVEPHVPKKDKRLMAYIVKTRAKQLRKKSRKKAASKHGDGEDVKEDNEEEEEEETATFEDDESDDEWIRSLVSQKKKNGTTTTSSKKHQFLRSDSSAREGGGGVNLLDVAQISRRLVSSKKGGSGRGAHDKEPEEVNDGIVYDKQGRLVIEDPGDDDVDGMKVDHDGKNETETREARRHRLEAAAKKSAAENRILTYRRRLEAKRGGGSNKATSAHTGKNYKSSKGKGDVKKQGQHDPYAYIRFDRKMLGKRRKRDAVGQFGNVLPTANRKGKRSRNEGARSSKGGGGKRRR
eukprot:g3667.t1